LPFPSHFPLPPLPFTHRSGPASPLLTKLTTPVFAWYTHHALPATPINPSSTSISIASQSYPTLASLSLLPHPTETSVSIITPPKVTKKVLEKAKKLGIKGVWLQPGSFDDEILKDMLDGWKETGVGGDGGRGGEGWCVLVDGERVAKAAGVHKL
jgi:predicted CoA-binding protein